MLERAVANARETAEHLAAETETLTQERKLLAQHINELQQNVSALQVCCLTSA
jgi:hypothetical protein